MGEGENVNGLKIYEPSMNQGNKVVLADRTCVLPSVSWSGGGGMMLSKPTFSCSSTPNSRATFNRIHWSCLIPMRKNYCLIKNLSFILIAYCNLLL